MKRRLEISELIFRIISYLLLTVFALCCLYPFFYAVSASISSRAYVENGLITRWADPALDENGEPVLDAEAGVSGQTLVWAVPKQETVNGQAQWTETAEGTEGAVRMVRSSAADGTVRYAEPALAEDGAAVLAEGEELVWVLPKQEVKDGEPQWNEVPAGTEGAVRKARWTERAQLILLPKAVQFDAFAYMFNKNEFWNSYSNTLFLTIYGTAWSLIVSVLGAYALSKKRLLFRKFFNFFLVFTMWFSAGVVPQFLNYNATKTVFQSIGIMDDKWMVVIAMGMAAMNIILLRNTFENVPSEIEEAAIVDGATEMQVLRQVYIPMSKSTIATVTLFFAVSRWNGYFWARQMITQDYEKPLQVFIQATLTELTDPDRLEEFRIRYPFARDSAIYALIVCSIIPILVIYPFIQKYFAKGTNAGGVKE